MLQTSLYKELGSEIADGSKFVTSDSLEKDFQKLGNVPLYPLGRLANKAVEELPEDVDLLHREV